MKTGIRLSSLGLPLRQVLPRLTKLNLAGVQLDITGELLPDQLSQTGRRQLRHLIESHDLKLSALYCPLRHGLDIAENLQPRIDHVQKVMSLSVELGAKVVIVQAGKIPEKPDDPAARFLTEALLKLGQHGDRIGTTLALETGLESGELLAQYLARFDSGGLGVSFDPHNLLVNRIDPIASAAALGGRIVHASAHDARQSSASRAAAEVPLGRGDINWLRLLELFEEIEYSEWLVIEREQGIMSLEEAAASVDFLGQMARPPAGR